MALVLDAVAQQIAMKLTDVILGNVDLAPRGEDRLHDLSVTGDLLLVAAVEALDFEVREQPPHVPVRKPAALNARRGADALDGRDPPQR